MWECVLGYYHDPPNSYRQQLTLSSWSPSYSHILFAVRAFGSSLPPNRHSSYSEERHNISETPQDHSSDPSLATQADVAAYSLCANVYPALDRSMSNTQSYHPSMSHCATTRPYSAPVHNVHTSPLVCYEISSDPVPPYNPVDPFGTHVAQALNEIGPYGPYQSPTLIKDEGNARLYGCSTATTADSYASMTGQGSGHAGGSDGGFDSEVGKLPVCIQWAR